MDTGLNTMTGGRIKQAKQYLGNEYCLLTYGDGLSNVNINTLVDFHKMHMKAITMTAVQPDGRYGALDIIENNLISSFDEKPKGDGSWINGGFFVCQPKVLDYIDGDEIMFEQQPLSNLALDSQLMAFKHEGFWQSMDTLRDKKLLCNMWDSGNAPWKNWT